MNKNINSFAQNVNKVVENSANTISLLGAMQQSMTTNDTFVTYDYNNENGETIRFQLPSYDALVNRIHALESSFESIVNGKGMINLEDGGVARTIKVSTLPIAPDQITGLSDPSTFDIDSNWFFEQLMFPGATVEIDLTDKIDDTADRVRISRIILNSNDTAAETLWMNDLSNNLYDYTSLKTLLSQNNVAYYEDEQTVDLPLVRNQVSGTFQVSEDPRIINGNLWYVLDSLTYSTINNDGVDQGKNNILSVGDKLNYADSLFEVVEINQNANLVRLRKTHGVATPGIYSVFSYYEDPYRSKVVNVRFGAHEYDIIYIKAIAEESNLLANQWSTPVRFATDELVLNGTSGQTGVDFVNYYNQYIMDWGANMIAEAKEHKIAAWYGKTPNAPTLVGDDFRVVQINTQINAAIDTTDVKNTASEIESTKSQIASLKQTIAAQKTDLQSAADTYTYTSIQQQIATNTVELNNLQTTYTTLVESFQTIVRENSAILAEPKYHIRGFFPIPPLRYYDDNETVAEQIIGFDIAYRYIKEDNTATQLNTFTYTDADGITKVTGTFTDWVIQQGHMREKVYDDNMQRYVWRSENIADGTETNINQIDIAINKGEKVEFMVRSISEAGYPENPLKSKWSNSVIIEFPSTLSTTNEIADLITMVNDDALQITINNTLDSIGVSVHLDDTVANTNSVVGTYYKHLSKNIAYEEKKIENGITTINTINLQDKLDEILRSLNYATALNEKQVSDISTLDKIQKDAHTRYDASLNDIFENFEIHMLDSSVELASKIDIEEYTKISDKLVLNASSNTYETQVVLEVAGGKGSQILDVLQKDPDDAEEINAIIRVADVYIDSSSLKSTLFEDKNSIGQIQAWSKTIDTSVSLNELEIAKKALHTDLVDVSAKLDKLDTDTRNVIYNDELHAQGSVFVNKDRVMLSTSPGSGTLYVYDGQSKSVLTDVKAKNVIIYPSGNEDSGLINLTDVYDNVQDMLDKVSVMERTVTTIQENYIDPVISAQGATYIVSANSIHADNYIETVALRIRNAAANNEKSGYTTFTTGADMTTLNYISEAGAAKHGKLTVDDMLFDTIEGIPISLKSFYKDFEDLQDLFSFDTSGNVDTSANTLTVKEINIGPNPTNVTTIKTESIASGLDSNILYVNIPNLKAGTLYLSSTVPNLLSYINSLNTTIAKLQGDVSTLIDNYKTLNENYGKLETRVKALEDAGSGGGGTDA